MIVSKISKNIYDKFFVNKKNSQSKNEYRNNIDKFKEQKTYWESIQKLKPLVK